MRILESYLLCKLLIGWSVSGFGYQIEASKDHNITTKKT